MRWYVQLSAVFDAIVGESVLDSVAFDLARQGVLYGSDAVQGNAGPSLDMTLAVEAPSDSEAAEKASPLVIEALSRAGSDRGSYRFESRVISMAGVEERMKAAASSDRATALRKAFHSMLAKLATDAGYPLPDWANNIGT